MSNLQQEEEILTREVHRKGQAERIFNDQLFQDAVSAIKDGIWKDFAASDLKDNEARTLARLKLDVLNKLLTDLRRHIETGRLSEGRLAQIQDIIKRNTRRRRTP